MASVVVCLHYTRYWLRFVSGVLRFSYTSTPSLPSLRFAPPRHSPRHCFLVIAWSLLVSRFHELLAEAERLVKGVNILVVTPGRLLDHLQVWHDGIIYIIRQKLNHAVLLTMIHVWYILYRTQNL